jgi:hypothetical protein
MDGEKGTLLRVDGRLEGEFLDEFEQACAASRPPLTLDLKGLSWVDEPAAASLVRLVAEGAIVTNASPFIALRLKDGMDRTGSG